MRDSLTVRAADFGIVLEDIAITHLSFGTEFTRVRHSCSRQLLPSGIINAGCAASQLQSGTLALCVSLNLACLP